jgi:hypothetical protein
MTAKKRPDSFEEYQRKQKERRAEKEREEKAKSKVVKLPTAAKKPVVNTTKKPNATEKALTALVASDGAARKDFVKRIREAIGKSVEGFVDVGRTLIEAKEKLQHGQFENMIEADLSMSTQTAQKLMAIARHPVISKAAHARDLPAAWSTLYELTKVPEGKLKAKLDDGTINPSMERKDVAELIPPKKKTEKAEKEEREPKDVTRYKQCPHCGGTGKLPVGGDF